MSVDWEDVWETLDLDAVEAELGLEVERRRDEDWASCPLPTHAGADANPSFSINREMGVFKCFACDRGGTLVMLVEDVRGLSSQAALDWLAQFSDVRTSGYDREAFLKRLRRRSRRAVDAGVVRHPVLPWFPPSVIEQWCERAGETDYFASRGIAEETVEAYRLGYAPMFSFRGYEAPAVILPHFFESNLVGWQARWIDDDRPRGIPKYVNRPVEFPKSLTLFGWDQRTQGDPVIVCESVMTVLRLHTLGHSAIATFGASVSEEQIRLLQALQGGVMLSFDNDGSGRRAQAKVSQALHGRVPLEIIPFPEGAKADLGDLTKRKTQSQIAARVPLFRAPTAMRMPER